MTKNIIPTKMARKARVTPTSMPAAAPAESPFDLLEFVEADCGTPVPELVED
jgi:hypothetical protein